MRKCSSIIENKKKYQSYFDKSLKDFVISQIKFYCICVFSLGLAYPWALCMKYKAQYHHTVICGKRLKFIGDPEELAFHWMVWWGLSVITCGIYGFVAHIRMERWITANTIFEEIEEIQEGKN